MREALLLDERGGRLGEAVQHADVLRAQVAQHEAEEAQNLDALGRLQLLFRVEGLGFRV